VVGILTKQRSQLRLPELTVNAEEYSLLTDLYQLTMAACYVKEGLDTKPSRFELFARRLPDGFGYLVAMGLVQVLEYLERFKFSPEQIEALQSTGIFDGASDRFWDTLLQAKFTGDVWAVPEGTVVFANEPILRVEAPLWQAQLVETYLLNTINYQTLVATRAARLRDVAGEEATLLEFGTRRAFSPQASLWAARAALAGGLDATSNVLAALKLGEKPSGTMAHSLVMAMKAIEGSESDAFTAFHRSFPGAPLLIDTYDTIAAATDLATKVKAGAMELSGVRIDSGDLVSVSQQVRSLLPNVPIFASGDLDEYEIARLKAAGACIEGYGLGTKLVTGNPVNGVYKLVEIDGIPTMKQSNGKSTYPGCKQIFRLRLSSAQGQFVKGKMQEDRLGLMTDTFPDSQPLLKLVCQQGKNLQLPESLGTIRQRTRTNVTSLPAIARQLQNPQSPPVIISESLSALTHLIKSGVRAQGLAPVQENRRLG
jgi:nicotinate phosphoribosyltransferase